MADRREEETERWLSDITTIRAEELNHVRLLSEKMGKHRTCDFNGSNLKIYTKEETDWKEKCLDEECEKDLHQKKVLIMEMLKTEMKNWIDWFVTWWKFIVLDK